MSSRDTKRNKWLAIWLIVLPMVLAVIYYALFAQNRYVSTSLVAVRQVGGHEAPQIPGLAAMMGVINPASREETLYLREFITSADMLNVLESKLDWRSRYEGHWRDPFYWLREDASREDTIDFYRRVVKAHFDEITGLLSVEVQAFDQEFAQASLKVILTESERFINELSHRMAREQMAFSQSELANARRAYEDRRAAMLDFQSANNLLDAQASAHARAGVIADIEGLLTRERAALKGMMATLSPESPQVRQQRIRIQALEQQIKAEGKSLISSSAGEQLNVVAARYRNLSIDSGIAEDAYKFAVSAVETARVEASKKLRALVTVVMPNEPEEPVYPWRIYSLITIFLGLLLLYGIVRFVLATIEDHKD
ncbi:ABC transporter permease [Alcaligenaceae bacterium C4P045]|nr:ABC transporter permease [Alcaligenaceae bacterium C4P045]